MTISKIVLCASLGLVALTTTASAHDANQADIDRREAIQEQRIQAARRHGQITSGEYRQLEAEQARIRQLERNALRDGNIDRREATQIREAQNQAGRHITQESTEHRHVNRWNRWW